MKCVCICCFDHYATRMRSIIDFFKSKGFETTYIISDYQHYGKYRFKAEYDNTVQIHVPEYKKNMSVNRIVSHLLFSKKVYRELCRIKPDVIFCNFPPNSLVETIIKYKRRNQCKVISDCYDLWPESFPYTKLNPILKTPFSFWKKLRDQYINESDLVTCVSEDGKERLTQMGVKPAIRVINPIIISENLPVFKFLTENHVSLCYLGHINHVTDVKLCIDLLSNIEKHKHVIFHHIGEGQNKEILYSGLAAAGVEIHSHGVVFDQEKKTEIYAQCDFGLNIPREEIHSSMALKSLEYMMIGLPLLNAGVGDIHEIVENARLGINIQRDDIVSCAAEIAKTTAEDLWTFHNNYIDYYNNAICNQNLTSVFEDVL